MKVLFDECIPRPLRLRLREFDISTAQEEGWGRLTNGDLLAKAEGVFDVFVTSDKNLKYQQNLSGRRLAILQLPTNHWPTPRPFSRRIGSAIAAVRPGGYVEFQLVG